MSAPEKTSAKADKEDKTPKLEDVVKGINKKYGPGTVLRASDAEGLVLDRVTTNVFDLDLALGGGLPRGRISVFKGEWSTGKSAIALKLAASFQRHCRKCGTPFAVYRIGGTWDDIDCKCGKRDPMKVIWADIESIFDNTWATKWQVLCDQLYVIQPSYGEQMVDVIDACIRSQDCDLVVVDSIAAISSQDEIEKSAEEFTMGSVPRLMGKAMRKWTSGMNAGGLLGQSKVSVVLINQYRMKIGGYGNPITSPGGKAIDFFQSVEARMKRASWITDPSTGRSVALEAEVEMAKNKTAPAMSGARYRLYFVNDTDEGYVIGDTDTDRQIIRRAVFWGLLEKSGSWFNWEGEKFQGEDAVALQLRKHPQFLDLLANNIKARELAWMDSGNKEGVVYEATKKGKGSKDS